MLTYINGRHLNSNHETDFIGNDYINKLVEIAPVLEKLYDTDAIDFSGLDETTLLTLYELGSTMYVIGDAVKRAADTQLNYLY